MRYNPFSSWSWPRHLALLGGVLMPLVLGVVLLEIKSWLPQTLFKADQMGKIVYSPTEPLLACTFWNFTKGGENKIQVWNTQRRTLMWSHDDPELDFNSMLVFSPDGTMLASATDKVVIWDAHDGHRIVSIPKAQDVGYWPGLACPIQFSPGGKTVQAGDSWFDVRSGHLVHKLGFPSYYAISSSRILKQPPFSGKFRKVETLRTSPDQKSALRILAVLQNENGKLSEGYVPYSQMPNKMVLTFGYQLWLCDSKGNLVRQLQADKDSYKLNDMVFSRDGRWLVVDPSPDLVGKHELQIWDAHTGQIYRRLTNASGVSQTQFSRDGRHLFTWWSSGKTQEAVAEWDLESGKVIRTVNPKEKGYFVLLWSVSPDGSTLAAVRAKGDISSFHDCAVRTWRIK